MRQCYQIKVFGQVQGVGFRRHAKAEATKQSLNGICQNLADGSVLIEVEGEAKATDEFIKWCQSGPERAHVSELTYSEVPLRNYNTFIIKP